VLGELLHLLLLLISRGCGHPRGVDRLLLLLYVWQVHPARAHLECGAEVLFDLACGEASGEGRVGVERLPRAVGRELDLPGVQHHLLQLHLVQVDFFLEVFHLNLLVSL
jgi:hypothetical protein